MAEPTTKSSPRRVSGSSTQTIDWYTHPDQVTTNSWARTWTNTADGVKNPRWKEQVRRGQEATTSFTGERVICLSHPYQLVLQNFMQPGQGWQTDDIWSYMNVGFPIPGNVPATPVGLSENLANTRALTILARKIRSKQTTFNGSVFVGELAQSVKLIANPAQGLRNLFGRCGRDVHDKMKKFQKANAGRNRINSDQLAAVRDTWLEYSLGWAPLVSEIDSGLEALAQRNLEVLGEWQPVRAVGVDKTIISTGTNVPDPATTPSIQWRVITYDEVIVRYIACVDIGTHSITSLQRTGFAGRDFLPTVWELLPYSFVIDYFVNIGNIIDAFSVTRSGVRWMVKTVRRSKGVVKESPTPIKPADNTHYRRSFTTLSPGKGASIIRTHVTRSPYYGSLVPPLDFKIPGLTTQWLNIAGLVHARDALKIFYR